jgi:hypothetical protein
MKSQDEAFYYLWEHGHRLINEDQKNSMDNGVYSNRNGVVKGYTINGLKVLASKGKLKLDGINLTPEEVEMMFNYGKFMQQIKY